MYVLLGLISLVAFAYLTRKKYPKVKGIYSQDHGLWWGVKFVIAFVLLSIRSAVHRIWRRCNSKHTEQGDWDSPDDFVKDDKYAMNTWALIGGDKKGNVLLVRMCRRLQGRIEIWLILRLADGRTFSHPAHPETLVQDETPFGDESDEGYMAGAGMRFRCIEPAKTYRFAYAGLMRLHSPDDATLATDGYNPVTNMHEPTPSNVEVDIRVWFRALADPAEYLIDGHPEALARALANEDWSLISLKRSASGSPTPHHQQSGEMRGFVKIMNGENLHLGAHENIEHIPLTLHGMRNRKRGRRNWSNYYRYLAHFGTLENGVSFSLTVLCDQSSVVSHLLSGFIMKPNGFVYAVSWSDIHLANFPDSPNNLPVEYEVHFMANRELYVLKVRRFSAVTLPHGEDWGAIIFLSPARFEINGVVGSGDVEYEHKNDGRLVAPKSRLGITDFDGPQGPKTGLVRNVSVPKWENADCPPFCLSLDEPLCCQSALTGGKSAKLALLLQASKTDVDFIVPDGFALTVGAFQKQLASVPDLRTAVDEVLTACGFGQQRGQWRIVQPSTQKMQTACERAVTLFKTMPLALEVKDSIRCYMEKVFGPEWKSVFVAVRSSAVGEDSAEASAAGQMETYLYIQGEHAIEEAVRKCWASNFDFRAIQYRRQICTKLDPSMGVLIQRLVPAETAGVMFTRDPGNGSTARLIINASFGVGEDVVSGAVEPDTITVHRHDFIDSSKLDVVFTQIGSKRRANSDGEEHHRCCLSEDNVKRLAQVGVDIERIFGSARDIEWAIAADEESAKKGLIGKTKIHILQARPITTMDAEEDWELERELDTPLASDHYEIVTTANVQEMMPAAMTPLSGVIWPEALGKATDRFSIRNGIKPSRRIYVPRGFMLSYQHIFFNYTITCGTTQNADGKRAMEMSFFGELKPDLQSVEEMHEYIDYTSKWLIKYHQISGFILLLWPSEWFAKRFERRLDATFAPHSTDPEILYQQIMDLEPLMRDGWLTLFESCILPIACQMMLLSIINPEASTWSATDVADLGILLSSVTDMFTGDVPTLMQAMAIAITKAGCRKSFLAMDNTAAADWLISNAKEAEEPRRLMKQLMEKHGHRCVLEEELREKCWRQQPEKLVEAVKAILGAEDFEANMNKPHTKREVPVDEAIASVSRPINPSKLRFLRWILPIARRAVGRREWGKSLAIRSMEACRVACHRLGVLMAERGTLPDEDLVFFFTPYELGKIIRRSSPKLIFKAQRRRRLHDRLMKMEFEEIIRGYPTPLSSEATALTALGDANLVIKGIPIGTGFIEGTARVLSSFEQAHEIKNGEILVVPYTDVGWTPYFSLITGLITELGGLLSHGAVIAREYGLPCLVGCKRATKVIPNGARIRIDCKTASLTVIGSESH